MIAVGASGRDSSDRRGPLHVGDRERRVHDPRLQAELAGQAPEVAQPVRVGHELARRRQERDAAVAELGQSTHGQPDRGFVVRVDPADARDAVRRRVQRDHRGTRAQVMPEPDRLAGADRGDGQACHPLRRQFLHVPALAIQRVARVQDQQRRSRIGRDLLSPAEHFEEERVGEVADHEAVGGGAPPPQRLGLRVGAVAEPFGRGQDAVPGRLGHARLAVDGQAGRGEGDADSLGDIPDADRPAGRVTVRRHVVLCRQGWAGRRAGRRQVWPLRPDELPTLTLHDSPRHGKSDATRQVRRGRIRRRAAPRARLREGGQCHEASAL